MGNVSPRPRQSQVAPSPGGRRPRRDAPAAQGAGQGRPPRKAVSEAVRGTGAGVTRPSCSPGSSGGYQLAPAPGHPPARPLAQVPRPGRGPRRTACSPAAPRRPVRPCTPRSRRWPGACRRGDAASSPDAREDASAGRTAGPAPGCSASVGVRGGGGAAGRGPTSGPHRPARLSLRPRRPGAPPSQRGGAGVGGRFRRGPGEKQPPGAQLPRAANAQGRKGLGRVGGERALRRESSGFGERPMRPCPVPAAESLPSVHPLGSIHLEPDSNQPLGWPSPPGGIKFVLHFIHY